MLKLDCIFHLYFLVFRPFIQAAKLHISIFMVAQNFEGDCVAGSYFVCYWIDYVKLVNATVRIGVIIFFFFLVHSKSALTTFKAGSLECQTVLKVKQLILLDEVPKCP